MLIIALPVIGFILSFFSRFVGKNAAILLSIGSIILTFFYTFVLSFQIIGGNTLLYTIPWFTLQNMNLSFTILIDALSILMSLLITFITSLVMVYSCAYLKEDPS
jgi:NADH-quinone oxidoreductase subunit L